MHCKQHKQLETWAVLRQQEHHHVAKWPYCQMDNYLILITISFTANSTWQQTIHWQVDINSYNDIKGYSKITKQYYIFQQKNKINGFIITYSSDCPLMNCKLLKSTTSWMPVCHGTISGVSNFQNIVHPRHCTMPYRRLKSMSPALLL